MSAAERIKLTPAQVALARHALGLPNSRNRSAHNRYIGGEGHAGYAEWVAMVAAGLACVAGRVLGNPAAPDDLFWLTRATAERVLLDGESLNPWDFRYP